MRIKSDISDYANKLRGFDFTGFAAKEVIVSTLGTAYSLGEVNPKENASLSDRLRGDPAWNVWVALSLIAFVLLYAPCFGEAHVIHRLPSAIGLRQPSHIYHVATSFRIVCLCAYLHAPPGYGHAGSRYF